LALRLPPQTARTSASTLAQAFHFPVEISRRARWYSKSEEESSWRDEGEVMCIRGRSGAWVVNGAFESSKLEIRLRRERAEIYSDWDGDDKVWHLDNAALSVS
jgi:hypothetical protein